MAKKETREQKLLRHEAEARVEDRQAGEREARRVAAKARFIEHVADFLTTGVARKSMRMELGDVDAKQWAAIANSIPGGNGYDDRATRIKQLTQLLA